HADGPPRQHQRADDCDRRARRRPHPRPRVARGAAGGHRRRLRPHPRGGAGASLASAPMAAPEHSGVRCDARFTTYPDLFERALRATRGLHELGIGAGDRVALLLRNSIEFLEASIATVPLGANAVPINWHWRGGEVAHVLLDSGAKALVVHADLLPAIASSVPEGLAVVVVPAGAEGSQARLPDGARRWPDWLAASDPWEQAPQTLAGSVIYTSGTTGLPKGV